MYSCEANTTHNGAQQSCSKVDKFGQMTVLLQIEEETSSTGTLPLSARIISQSHRADFKHNSQPDLTPAFQLKQRR